MTEKEHRPPRISVELEDDLHRRLQENVRWGLLKPLINNMLEDFLDLCEGNDSNLVIAAIISDEISLKDIIKRKSKAKRDQDGEHT